MHTFELQERLFSRPSNELPFLIDSSREETLPNTRHGRKVALQPFNHDLSAECQIFERYNRLTRSSRLTTIPERMAPCLTSWSAISGNA